MIPPPCNRTSSRRPLTTYRIYNETTTRVVQLSRLNASGLSNDAYEDSRAKRLIAELREHFSKENDSGLVASKSVGSDGLTLSQEGEGEHHWQVQWGQQNRQSWTQRDTSHVMDNKNLDNSGNLVHLSRDGKGPALFVFAQSHLKGLTGDAHQRWSVITTLVTPKKGDVIWDDKPRSYKSYGPMLILSFHNDMKRMTTEAIRSAVVATMDPDLVESAAMTFVAGPPEDNFDSVGESECKPIGDKNMPLGKACEIILADSLPGN